jgi:hypothetical protein
MPRATDFGIDTTAISNATGPLQRGSLADLLQNLAMQPAVEANQLQQAIQEAQGQQGPSLLQRLLSPAGALIAAGSILAGKEGGLPAAAAFGLGGLKGIENQQILEEEAQAKAIADLQKQRDDALDRVEKTQQRVSTMFNTNPDAFIDPETGEPTVTPETMGLITSGFPIRIFPQTRRKLEEADAAQQARHDVFTEALQNTDNVADARQIIDGMMGNMGWTGVPEGVKDSLARAMGTDNWTPTMANIIAQNATNAPDVFVFAAENKLPLEDYRVLQRIDWREKALDMPTLAEQNLLLVQRYNEWLQQNPQEAGEVRRESPTDLDFLRGTVDRAFADEPGSGQQLKQFFDVNETEAVALMQSYQEVLDSNELASMLAGYKELPAIQNMTDEERARYYMNMALELTEAKKQELLRGQATQDAAWVSSIEQQLRSEFPDLGPGNIATIKTKMFERARDAAVQPDGRVDRARFEQAVQAEMQKLREDLGR